MKNKTKTIEEKKRMEEMRRKWTNEERIGRIEKEKEDGEEEFGRSERRKQKEREGNGRKKSKREKVDRKKEIVL